MLKCRVNLKKVFCYLFVLFAVFATDSMITISINVNTSFYYGMRIAALILCPVFLLLAVNIKALRKNFLCITLLLGVSLVLTAVLNSDYAYIILLKLVYFLLGYCAVKYFGSDNIVKAYVHIMLLITVWSLVCYVISIFSLAPFSNFPEITIVAAKSKIVSRFYNAFFAVLPQTSYDSIVRNYGMFAEPGIYQVYLLLAMMLVLYKKEFKHRTFSLGLFVLAMLTTFSTTGYIVTILLLFVYFVTNYEVKYWQKLVGFFIVVVAIGIIAQNEYLADLVFGKLQNKSNASTISRLYSFVVNFKIWLRNPAVGVGPVNVNALSDEIAYALTGSTFFHNTNTFMYTLGCYGIGVFGIEMWKAFRFSLYLDKSKMAALCLLVVMVLCLSGENLTHSLLIETILFCGAVKPKENAIKGGCRE